MCLHGLPLFAATLAGTDIVLLSIYGQDADLRSFEDVAAAMSKEMQQFSGETIANHAKGGNKCDARTQLPRSIVSPRDHVVPASDVR